MVPLGIDREKLNIQLSRLEEHIIELQVTKEKLPKQKDDLLISAAERLLHLSIEDCLNIGNHIISGLGLKRADNYREIFVILEQAKIISKGLTEQMQNLSTLRNRLVHLYWKVTTAEMIEALNNIDIFRKYAKEIVNFFKNKGTL